MKKYLPTLKQAFLVLLNIAILAVITYASTNQTLEFFGSIGEGKVRESNWLMALANDSCKIYLPICVGIAWIKRKYILTLLLIVTILCTITVSYLASQGLDLNVANKDIKEAMTNDSRFTMNTSTFQDSNSYLKELRQKKSAAESVDISTTFDSDSIIISLQSEYDNAKKRNWRTTTKTSGRRGMDVISKDIQARKQTIEANHKQNIADIQTEIQQQENLRSSSSLAVNSFSAQDAVTTTGFNNLAKFLKVEVGTITRFKNALMEFMSLVLSLNLGCLLGEHSETILNRIKRKTKDIGFGNVIAKGKMLAKRKTPKDTVTATLTTDSETVALSSPQATAAVTGNTEFYPHEEAKKPKKEYKTRKIGFSQGSTLDKATKEYMRFILTNVKPDGTLLGITNLEKVCKKQGLTNTRGTWDTMKKLSIIEKVNGSMVINQDMVNKWL